MHHVWVSLDKFYPGNVYGFNVYVWADTKEVYYIHKRVSTIEPPEELVASAPEDTQPSDYQTANSSTVLASNNLLSIVLIILVVCITILFMLIPAYLSAKKKMPFSLLSLPKTRFFKVSCVLLCFLTLSSLLIVLWAQPVAGSYFGGASVWGSESTGSRDPPVVGESWRKSDDEVDCQRNIASCIDGLFAANGYSSMNNQGSNNSGSLREAILSYVRSLEQNYPQYAVVDFDHGVGISLDNVFHYMFEDNNGTIIGTEYPGTTVIENAVYQHLSLPD